MILVDSDILIDYLRRNPKALDLIKKNNRNITISDFNKIELFAGCENKREIKAIAYFLDKFKKLKTTSEIIENAVNIFEKHLLQDGIDPMDAIFASTSIYYNTDFYTKNIKHYKNIKGLKLYKAY